MVKCSAALVRSPQGPFLYSGKSSRQLVIPAMVHNETFTITVVAKRDGGFKDDGVR